jgi:putative ABC transport system ATP-binding protein
MTEALLEARDVHKQYPDGQVRAVNGVSLGVRAGEFVAVTGPSGCGKSTLLNLLGALDRPDSGEVFFRGEPLSQHSDLDRFRSRQIGFVFQSFFLLPTLTARENVQVPMFGGSLGAAERAKKADELLDLVGMGRRAGHRSAQLSVGERQRVALARALVSRPKLLLLDEPFGALDALTRIEMQNLLADLWRRERFTVVLITHDVVEAAMLADRVLVLRDGRIRMDVPVNAPRPRESDDPEVLRLEKALLKAV